MPKYTLVDGDVTTLTRAFNALREGMGTYLGPAATLDGFLSEWKDSTSAFASESGFIGIVTTNHPAGSATAVLCQFESGPVSAEVGDEFRKLSRELLKGFDLQVIRAPANSVQGDRILTLSGFTRDGLLRKVVADGSGVLRDLGVFSLTVDDLVEKEPLIFVHADTEADNGSERVDVAMARTTEPDDKQGTLVI